MEIKSHEELSPFAKYIYNKMTVVFLIKQV